MLDVGCGNGDFLNNFLKNKKIKKVGVETAQQTINFCKSVNANFIVRGVRNNGDFEFEKAIARTNRLLSKIETVFLLTSAKTSFISSSIVRDLIQNNGDYSKLVPKNIYNII